MTFGQCWYQCIHVPYSCLSSEYKVYTHTPPIKHYRLSDQYMQNATDNKHLLKQQFFQLQFNPGHEVMQHITAIEAKAKQLKDLGEPVPEIDTSITKSSARYHPAFETSCRYGTVCKKMRKRWAYSQPDFWKRKEQTRGLTMVKVTPPMKPSSHQTPSQTQTDKGHRTI